MLSVVLVAYEMTRELPRTLRSLAPAYQRGIDAADYEVVLVDNGSPTPVDPALLDAFPGQIRMRRLDPASASPAHAANTGIEMATGELVGLMIDGARLASPGLLAQARLAAGLATRPVIATLAWHVGTEHMQAAALGYDQAAEDRLLKETDWENDGYRLFGISTLAGSSRRGWFGPLGESNALFLPRDLWVELGGLDERFALPGGGRVNHDLFSRACALPGARVVVLLGEGTFHQIHGGAATSRRVGQPAIEDEYTALRGTAFTAPDYDALYVGTVPPAAIPHLERSVQWARRHAAQTGQDTRLR